jgi:hypothetical protein
LSKNGSGFSLTLLETATGRHLTTADHLRRIEPFPANVNAVLPVRRFDTRRQHRQAMT